METISTGVKVWLDGLQPLGVLGKFSVLLSSSSVTADPGKCDRLAGFHRPLVIEGTSDSLTLVPFLYCQSPIGSCCCCSSFSCMTIISIELAILTFRHAPHHSIRPLHCLNFRLRRLPVLTAEIWEHTLHRLIHYFSVQPF